MVRGLLLATAATMAMTVCAQAQTNGSIDISRTNHDSGFGFDVTGVNGAIYHDFGNGFGVQGEIQYHDLDFGVGDAQNTRYGLHGLYRTENWAVGALVGTGDWFSSDFDHWGVEGAFYFDRWTLQGSYISGDLPSVTVDRLNFSGRYFVTDNFSLGGGVAFGSADEVDWNSYDLNAEYRFGGAPIAIFAGYNRGDFEDAGDDTDSVRFGLRWDIGTGSLIERDRHGASFNDVETFMQDIYRLD
jgi:hypothetical protein